MDSAKIMQTIAALEAQIGELKAAVGGDGAVSGEPMPGEPGEMGAEEMPPEEMSAEGGEVPEEGPPMDEVSSYFGAKKKRPAPAM